jgi:hypothetical protein
VNWSVLLNATDFFLPARQRVLSWECLGVVSCCKVLGGANCHHGVDALGPEDAAIER